MLKNFVFIDIWFVKQDIQKWFKRYAVFYGEFENEKKKGQTFFDLLGFDLLLKFALTIWIIEGHEIQFRQES